ncbi:class I SAM-dependent DNA methyltransferase [Nonomuraea gerenzanensis]|uniref:Similar to 2-polyprenyl-3-methyl-5-hydroxy-6-metoxy-1 4-benzoquinol methylase n=1 Tax=Nonomuraea gerenzanensis TaxID=93944 RepID=A0A1M4EDW3_9ACTN|nr:class I SAM-dependent methyltransferase [Nonomuraea gerenzanensis]UBU08613.1 class I SAM-dependent methyltransferase [Nonomuraea gerenzanensis]SBO96972.1 similar to 2-polyprenyl-3-methyl-5-hydroxy-6-metoxy-1 4-benzoquinol methylase [Nonomuraea gerenzanensis]
MKTHGELKGFWERRLQSDWTESGVGYAALGRAFNTWMYRVRAEVFDREAATLPLDLRGSRVLDIGSGTGFYVRRWQGLGVKPIVGCDLTAAAVERLRGRFPGVEFHELDIAEPGDVLEPGSFDAVSAMDMLFHITDDVRYRAALNNVAAALRPGGIFVLSENFLQRPEQRGDHQVNRTLPWINRALGEAGFDVMRRLPMLVLMNAQVDANSVWRKLWGGLLRAVTLSERTGALAGSLLYPLERRLVRVLRESPTTELMICRRR